MTLVARQCQGVDLVEGGPINGRVDEGDADGVDKHLPSTAGGMFPVMGRGSHNRYGRDEEARYARLRVLRDDGKKAHTSLDSVDSASPTASPTLSFDSPINPNQQPTHSKKPLKTPSPSSSMELTQQPTSSLRPWITSSPTPECEAIPRDEYLQLCLVNVTDVELLLMNTTSQGLAYEYLMSDSSLDVCNCDILQKYALATMFFATQGNNWINNSGWLVEPNECDWFQVRCDNNTRDVVKVTLGRSLDERLGSWPYDVVVPI